MAGIPTDGFQLDAVASSISGEEEKARSASVDDASAPLDVDASSSGRNIERTGGLARSLMSMARKRWGKLGRAMKMGIAALSR